MIPKTSNAKITQELHLMLTRKEDTFQNLSGKPWRILPCTATVTVGNAGQAKTLSSYWVLWAALHQLTLTVMTIFQGVLKQTVCRLDAFPVVQPTAPEHRCHLS